MSGTKRPTLLVGSLSLASRDDVFEAVSTHLKGDVRSVPDGETGDRGTWVGWESARLRELPEIVVLDDLVFESPVSGEFRVPLMAPAEGVDPANIDVGPLRYVEEAVPSYEVFVHERDGGKFEPETRFQISMPTPMMFASMFPNHRREVLVAFERAFSEQIDAIFSTIPARDLAMQWDVAGEVEIQEEFRQGAGPRNIPEKWPLTEATESLARVSTRVPEEALLGMHLCYGDPEGEHLIQPIDLQVPVDIASSAADLIERRLDWVHMPVPIDRDDDAYFAPLADLKLAPETQLYLGLVHKEDGIEGIKRRVAAASKYIEDFGVATECGMGREPRDEIAGLLDLHHRAGSI